MNGFQWLAWLGFGRSTIGQKVRMAITGLLLCGFLVVHLMGNILLYKPDNGEAYNNYAKMLHSGEMQGLIYVAEIGLLILFVIHLVLSIRTTIHNTRARPTEYFMKQTKQEHSMFAAPANSVMMVTGIAILMFTVLHLADFRFKYRPPQNGWAVTVEEGHHQPITRTDAIRLMRDPITAWVYIIGSLLLGYHLAHGFYSAFQSLGIAHPVYSHRLMALSIAFAVIIGGGFASFPIWANFVHIEGETEPTPNAAQQAGEAIAPIVEPIVQKVEQAIPKAEEKPPADDRPVPSKPAPEKQEDAAKAEAAKPAPADNTEPKGK